jgi:hypothetical protein
MLAALAVLAFAFQAQSPDKPFTVDGAPPVHEPSAADASPVGDEEMVAAAATPRKLDLKGFSLYPDPPVAPPLLAPRFDTSVEVVSDMPKDPNDAMAEWWRHWNFEYSIYGHGINVQPTPNGGFNILPLIDWLTQKAKGRDPDLWGRTKD